MPQTKKMLPPGDSARTSAIFSGRWALTQIFPNCFGKLSATSSGEGVGDRNVPNLLAILKVFTVKNVTLTFDRRRDDQRIVPRQAKPSSNPQRLSIQGWR